MAAFTTSDILTPQPTRQDFAQAFGNNQRLIRFFEQLTADVRTTIPNAIVSVQDISGAPFVLKAASTLAPNGFVLAAGTGLTQSTPPGAFNIALSVPVTIANGGTGATTATAALVNLGGVTASGAAAAAPVQSVFGRIGTVTAQTGDYSAGQVTNAASVLNPLSQFATTTSAQLATVLSDKTGSGFAVFSGSPALTGAPTAPTAALHTSTTQLATTQFVENEFASPPAIGATAANTVTATALTVNEPASSTSTITLSAASDTNGANLKMTGNGATTPSKTLRVQAGVFGIVNNAYSATVFSVDDTGNTLATGSLAASGNDALQYGNTSGQSIPSATPTTITNWTKNFDRLNANFNATTGVFTAPATGYYHISAQSQYASSTNTVGTAFQINLVVNGATLVTWSTWVQTASATIQTVNGSSTVFLTAGQTVLLQANQNTGAARTLGAGAGGNYISIHRVP